MSESEARGEGEAQADSTQRVIGQWSATAAAAILVPLSVADAAFIAPIEHKMAREISRIHGHDRDEDARRRFFKALRPKLILADTAIVGAKLMSALLRFLPFVGSLLGMCVAYAFTRTVGELSNLYFAGGCTMSPERISECFDVIYREQLKRTYTQRRTGWAAMLRNPDVRRRVKELRRARREGKLSADEARRRTAELLELHG